MVSLTLFSPAKINLFLRILQKREDGYHDLATLIQAVDWGDTLTFTLSSEDHFTCTHPKIPLDETNLVRKALALFRRKSGCHFPVRIHLDKQIPMEAGLGGGSSNAATTLWGLNKLAGSPVSDEALQQWSSEIGSDIPFFFSLGTAYCTGRGEKVRSLPFIPLEAFFLVKPSFGLSTARVFQVFQANETSARDPEELLQGFLRQKPLFCNDLEKPAFKLIPQLGDYKQTLSQTSKHVAMTGSGTAFFCFQPNQTIEGSRPIQAARRLPGEWYSLYT